MEQGNTGSQNHDMLRAYFRLGLFGSRLDDMETPVGDDEDSNLGEFIEDPQLAISPTDNHKDILPNLGYQFSNQNNSDRRTTNNQKRGVYL